MHTIPMTSWHSATMLALSSQSVIGLRLVKLGCGGPAAFEEACLMVSEKIHAAFEGSATLLAGGSVATVIDAYRGHVDKNIFRLTGLKSPRRREKTAIAGRW